MLLSIDECMAQYSNSLLTLVVLAMEVINVP